MTIKKPTKTSPLAPTRREPPPPSYEELVRLRKGMSDILTTMEQAATTMTIVSHDIRKAFTGSEIPPKTYMEISVQAFLHGELLGMACDQLGDLINEITWWDGHLALNHELEELLNETE